MAALIQNNQPSTSMESPQMVDRISDLPIPILHHILSFLPTRDVVRTCILSKHWCSTCSSFPILEFDVYDFRSHGRDSNPLDNNEAFLRWVDARVQRLYETNTNIVRLKVMVDLLDPRIFRAIESVLERNVQELDLDFHLLYGGSFIKHQHILYYSARSAVVYKLGGIDLNLPDLLRGCPLVQELNLRSCLLQETTIVNDAANNLKTLVFKNCNGMRDFVIRAPNLESFAYTGGPICAIHLAQTPSLKNARLCNILISDEWLENLIQGCPKLEFLKIFCNGLKRIAICHQQLKTLKLYDWTRNGGLMKIDTPELLHFTYNGTAKPFYMFNYSASLKATLNMFRHEEEDAPWFANLSKMLQWFSGCETLQLVPDDFYPKDLIFGMDIRDNSIPLVYGLKNLEIQLPVCWPRSPVPFIELIDAYLWLCPHLETLKITCEATEEAAFKFEREHILHKTKFMPLCCAEHPGECWKFSVKKVSLVSYVGLKDDKKWLLSYFQRVSATMETLENSSNHSKLVAEE